MLFQTQWRRHKTVEEINRRPSKTIPDQTMSIKEILTRYANGIPIDQGKVPIYEGEETDLPANWDKLDLSEQQDILQENKKRIMEMQYDLQVKQKQQEHEERQLAIREAESAQKDEKTKNEGNSKGEDKTGENKPS